MKFSDRETHPPKKLLEFHKLIRRLELASGIQETFPFPFPSHVLVQLQF